MPPIQLVVGLGNPGLEYARSRHNAGFMVIDRLLTELPGSWERIDGCNSFYFEGRFRGRNMWLQQPHTYMNLSGEAVRKLLNRSGVNPESVLVIHDDMDLPLGKIRLRKGGGAGGHHGVESVMGALGTAGFGRLRVGIGRPEGRSVTDFVLTDFTAEEKKLLEASLLLASEAVKCTLARGIQAAMNEFNGRSAAVEDETEING